MLSLYYKDAEDVSLEPIMVGKLFAYLLIKVLNAYIASNKRQKDKEVFNIE